MSLNQDKNKKCDLLKSTWFKPILIAFIYSCYNPVEIEFYYEDTVELESYSYNNYECGIDVYESEGFTEYEPSDSEQKEIPQTYWSPPLLNWWR